MTATQQTTEPSPTTLRTFVSDIRATDSLNRLIDIAKNTGSRLDEEDDERISGQPYQKLLHLINTGRSYYMFTGFRKAGYAGAFLLAVAGLDLLQQFVAEGKARSEAFAVLEALVMVFGALSVILLIPMADSAALDDKREFESVFGPSSLTKENLALLESTASELQQGVRKALSPDAVGSEELLVVTIKDFRQTEPYKLEKQRGEKIFDMIELTPQGVRAWREYRGGLNPRYLLLPYEVTWNMLKHHAEDGSDIRVGKLLIQKDQAGKLLQLQTS